MNEYDEFIIMNFIDWLRTNDLLVGEMTDTDILEKYEQDGY